MYLSIDSAEQRMRNFNVQLIGSVEWYILFHLGTINQNDSIDYYVNMLKTNIVLKMEQRNVSKS